jgi:Fic family protein
MEGNTLTLAETRSVMVGNLTVGGKPLKDVLEMKGHDEIISEILRVGKGEARLSEARIRQIHQAIMHEEDPEKRRQIGVWKTMPNYLYNYQGERYDFAPPSEVPERMHDLLNRTNAAIDAIVAKKKNAPHPLDVALQFHLDYVTIHPFYDGNGRTARILTNLLLISLGYPPFWVKDDERRAYGQYLADTQGEGGHPDLFFAFAADLILRSQHLVLAAMAGQEIAEPDDLEKQVSLLKQRLAQGRDDEVKQEKTDEVVKQIFASDIQPLIDTVINRLRQFEPLFKSRSVNYVVAGVTYANVDEFFANKKTINSIDFDYTLCDFRKAALRTFNAQVRLKIQFHPFVYEVKKTDGTIMASKLYHQHLTDEEKEAISEALGYQLLNDIEAHLAKID